MKEVEKLAESLCTSRLRSFEQDELVRRGFMIGFECAIELAQRDVLRVTPENLSDSLYDLLSKVGQSE